MGEMIFEGFLIRRKVGLLLFLFLAASSLEVCSPENTKENVDLHAYLYEKGLAFISGNLSLPFLSAASQSSSPTVKIGTFNLKQFGKKKANNAAVLKIIAQIVARYDLIALQEITDVKETAIKKLITSVNLIAAHPYQYVVSPRVGRNKQKEQYALMFRPDVFQVKRHTVYDDSDGDPFSREPQIAEIIMKSNGGKFGIINVHVAPRNASTEIDALTVVHSWVKSKWRLSNVIILGDLNADCDYIRKKDIPSIRLLNNPRKYHWLIPDDFDTTVGTTNCAYDRIIVSGPYLGKKIVVGSSSVFEFDREYRLGKEFAQNISDHYPVEIAILVESSVQADSESSGEVSVFGNKISCLLYGTLTLWQRFL